MTFIDVLVLLTLLSPSVLAIGLIVGILYFKRLTILNKSIFVYLSLMLFVDLTGRIMGDILHINNQIILPVYSLLELVFFLYFYKKHIFVKTQKAITLLGVIGILYIIGEIFYYFVFNTVHPQDFQPYAKVVDNFIVILMALAFFFEKISAFNDTKWTNFRLNIAILLFFTINLIMFLPFNFLVNESTGLKFYFWTVNLIITVLFYTYLISFILKNGKENKPNNKNRVGISL